MKKKKYRKHEWFNEKTGFPEYGIQRFHAGKWMHLCEGSKPCIYKTESERDAKLATLKEPTQ